jgi:fused signal recognition particle receptor
MSLFGNFNFNKLKDGLSKTRDKLVTSLNEVITGKVVVDDKTLDQIEEILVSSDIGYDITEKIIHNARLRYYDERDRSAGSLLGTIKKELEIVLSKAKISAEENISKYKPYVILIIGVNGAGKTTTIGKLAHNFKKDGLKVIVGAADTFRAAANEQLEIWAQRAGVRIVQNKQSSDPSSVVYETLKTAVDEKYDIVLIDTAGRLHNKSNLMEELAKIKRVMKKILDYSPNQTYLVLDGNTGQNALVQAEEFGKVTDITGLIITKLDGTAKGGVIFQICAREKYPVKYIGVGETIDDLQNFDPKLFISAIFEND